MDKQTESRKAFEAKIKEDLLFSDEELVWQQERNCYAIYGVHLAWWAWQKSRESLVVELPSKIAHLNISTAGTPDERGATYDIAIDKCAKAIRAIGIRIKGEGDGASS
ncbi:hypothetical protein J8629_15465 [Serratia fonticola]|uniref:hypothetical protein n=1 Tax=Serratia fonticola TaxID=47917 RepID=UPI001AE3B731|nr:hypothetical protein [Serratia fonticola]MBP0998450.1 hypothetical protein [Serratia fonticola]